MKAVTYQDVGNFQVTDAPDPKIQSPTDVILKTTRCSICGSDLHIYHGKVPGMEPGNVCGHEYTGWITCPLCDCTDAVDEDCDDDCQFC